jgi:hypothetical protein
MSVRAAHCSTKGMPHQTLDYKLLVNKRLSNSTAAHATRSYSCAPFQMFSGNKN